MPQSKSSAKRLRQSKKRQETNRALRSNLKTIIRSFEDKIKAGDREKARETLNSVYARLDRAVSKGIIKQNYAARQKSRLSRKLSPPPAS